MGSLIGLPCSLRPHDQNVLLREKARLGAPGVGRVRRFAQWETNSGHPPGRDEQAWREHRIRGSKAVQMLLCF